MIKCDKWSPEELNAVLNQLCDEISNKENELCRLKKQLEIIRSLMYVYSVNEHMENCGYNKMS